MNDKAGASAVPLDVEHDELDEVKIDFSRLHPSVRFYRGMWKLTQLHTDSDGQDSISAQPRSESPAAAPSSERPADILTARPKVCDLGVTVVALHQRLLPPAPVNGLGEVADESYAAQLATSDGIDFLRANWHLLLPLLFPTCSSAEEEVADANHHHVDRATAQRSPVDDVHTDTIMSAGENNERGAREGEVGNASESSWTASELLCHVRQRLTLTDLKVVRELGLMDRIYYSYIVLLRFYGWRVHDEERGLLDRNRAWADRYALLQQYRWTKEEESIGIATTDDPNDKVTVPEVQRLSPHCPVSSATTAACAMMPSPSYATFNFYQDGLPRVLRSLLDVGFLRLGVRLVEFMMEEMKSDRLVFLLPLVEDTLLPLVVNHENVETSHKTRLQKQLFRLTHSDSD